MALDNKHNISVGKSHYQDSSFRQLTGKAEYIDDIPLAENALHGALILSTIPSGKIVSVTVCCHFSLSYSVIYKAKV